MSSNSEFDAQARRAICGQGAQKKVVLPEFLEEEEAARLIAHITAPTLGDGTGVECGPPRRQWKHGRDVE
jgi:hypothetical protein